MSDSSINIHTHLEPHVSEPPAKRDETFVVTHPWIRHYEPGVPVHIEIPDQPLTWLLERTASRYPDRTALIYYGTSYFSIVERVKDVIIASGLKVYPREVEEVLFGHPAVAEAAVAGAADAYRGETVAAFVVLKPGIEASEETRRELLRYCKQELAAYKVPTILEFRASLPKSLIGKVLRRELRVFIS